MKKVLLLGAGHAHVQVLAALAKEPLASAGLTLVAPFDRQVYSGMVPGFVAGHYSIDDCSYDVAPLAAAARAHWHRASAIHIDAAARCVTLSSGEVLGYDVLSLDTGSVADRDAIAGARDHALFARPIEHFAKLWSGLLQLAESRPLSVAVIGAGAGGVELALALQHRLGDRAGVSLIAGDSPVLGSHAPRIRQRVLDVLRRHRIAVIPDRCVELTASQAVLASGARLACDAAVAVPGASAPAWLADSGLALDERGFVLTGPTLQSTSHPEVFAAGDVATREDRPHPRSGVYAVRAGPPLTANLRRFVAGGRPLEPYQPQRRALNLLACGERRAVAAWGDWSVQGAWVWWWKDRIDRAWVKRCRPPFGGR